jgi:POT family proton-dependent oligopeptide transporter
MPRHSTVLTIIFIRLLSALPFAIFYSSLELYLINIHFQNNTALVGSILALSFGLSLLGGYLGGRYLSYKSLFLSSILFQAIGCIVFSTQNHDMVLWFSSLFLLGSIGNTISINMMLTQLFNFYDYKRERAFFILYMFLNIGYLVGYTLAGYFANINQYTWIPRITLITSSFVLIIILLFWKKLDSKPLANKMRFSSLKLGLMFFASLIVLRQLLEHPIITNSILVILWLIFAGLMYLHIKKYHSNLNTEIKLFYLLLFSALIFWSVYFLAPMALIIFIKYHVNLRLGQLLIAPQWIQNINTVVIITGSIWFGVNIKTNSAIYLKRQFSKGLLLIGFGFLILALGIISDISGKPLNISWIVVSYVLQSCGELLIGPIGYALVGRLVPETYQSMMTGIWITLLGVASAIASFISSSFLSTSYHLNTTLSQFNNLFITMGFITIIFSIYLYFKKA